MLDQEQIEAYITGLLNIAHKHNTHRPLNADDRLVIADVQHINHIHSQGQIDIALGIIQITEKLRNGEPFDKEDDNLLKELAWIAQHQAYQTTQAYRANQKAIADYKRAKRTGQAPK
jgi:hypothetical protein